MTKIKNIWAHNLEEELNKISELLEKFPYVAMDTEFPGTIMKFDPRNVKYSEKELNHKNARINVNHLRIIQIGITLGDGRGNFPTPICTWQFNFKFDIDDDMYNADAKELLVQSGISFEKFKTDGISPFNFSELVYTSGLVMNDKITYITFHSIYDFAYLVKMLTCTFIPESLDEYKELLNILFPRFYDIKCIISDIYSRSYSIGLSHLADRLEVNRDGPVHQAGPDAFVTMQTFTALMKKHYNGELDCKRINQIFGLNDEDVSQSDTDASY